MDRFIKVSHREVVDLLKEINTEKELSITNGDVDTRALCDEYINLVLVGTISTSTECLLMFDPVQFRDKFRTELGKSIFPGE